MMQDHVPERRADFLAVEAQRGDGPHVAHEEHDQRGEHQGRQCVEAEPNVALEHGAAAGADGDLAGRAIGPPVDGVAVLADQPIRGLHGERPDGVIMQACE
jgi:hypothetical protein